MNNDKSISDRSLRIAILSHNLRSGGSISVGRNIISSLGRLFPENKYLITIPSDLGYEELTTGIRYCDSFVFRHDGNVFQRWLFDNYELPKIVNSWKPDYVLGLGNMGLYGNKYIPQAVLCHNSYLWYGSRHYGRTMSFYSHIKVRLQKSRFKKDLRNTQLVLCQTETAINRIRDMYCYKDRISLCPNAVSRFTLSENDTTKAADATISHRDKFRLLYLTKYYAHKNIEILVDLFEKYKRELASVVLFLTISPNQHAGAKRLLKAIDKKGLRDKIINLGPLPQEHLGSYFRQMNALIMPTLLESFSGSYLEAMHFGLPILTSDLDFAHEVCGPAAIYFDPWNVESIKNAIFELQNSPGLPERLIATGKTQLQSTFPSWDEIAKGLLNNLHEIVEAK